MPFAYYDRLSRRQQAIYDQSDRIERIPLPDPAPLVELTGTLSQVLRAEDQKRVTKHVNELARAICIQLGVRPVRVKVLAKRPSDHSGELHGLYESIHGAKSADITVWMRTAKRKQVVAFRTFLRTLLHELCHHLDYDLFKLRDSLHTEGFYKRESSLFHQLVPNADAPDARSRSA